MKEKKSSARGPRDANSILRTASFHARPLETRSPARTQDGVLIMQASRSAARDWAELPDDALKYIFGQLQPASLRGIRLVCSAWLKTVSRFIVSLQPETFRGNAQSFTLYTSLSCCWASASNLSALVCSAWLKTVGCFTVSLQCTTFHAVHEPLQWLGFSLSSFDTGLPCLAQDSQPLHIRAFSQRTGREQCKRGMCLWIHGPALSSAAGVRCSSVP